MVLAIVAVGVAQMLRGSWGPWHSADGSTSETARQILDKRYARGEITSEQYEQMKRSLDG
jgi:putative membrane protein